VSVTQAPKAPEHEGQLAFEIPQRLKMNFWSFTTADKYFTFVQAIIVVTVGFKYGRLAALLWILVWVGFMCRPENGRIYDLFSQACRTLRIRKRHGLIWTAVQNSHRSKKRRRRTKRQKENVMPFRTGDIAGGVGFIAYKRSDVIVIEGSGSKIIAQNPHDQFRTSLREADVIKRVASSVPGRKIAVSLMFRRRPANVRDIANTMGESLHPDVAVPEALLIPEEKWTVKQRADYNAFTMWMDSQNLMDEIAGEVTMAMVITIQRESKLARAMKGKSSLPDREVKRLTISRVKETAVEGLKACGVSDVHALDLEAINLYVRRSWDVDTIDEYYERMQKQWGGTEGLAKSKFHWPQERILAFSDHSVMDSTRHAVLRVRENPSRVLADYYRQLYAIDVPWLTVTLVSETVSSNAEYRMLNKLIPIRNTFDQVRGIVRKAPHQQKKEEEREKRERDLYNSRFGQAYVLLISVARPFLADAGDGIDEDDIEKREEESIANLEDDVMAVRQKTYGLGMDATHILTESRQLPALWSAVTGIPML
jgi:hypothetical protein